MDTKHASMRRVRRSSRNTLGTTALALALFCAAPAGWAAPELVVVESGGVTRVSENGNFDTYTLALSEAPGANVTVTVTFNTGPQISVDPPSLQFTDANYSTTQTVKVTAVDDPRPEGPHQVELTHNIVSTNPPQNATQVAPVTVYITDNDVGAVVVAESGGFTRVTEGGPDDYYELSLTTQPSSEVTITITTDREQPPATSQIEIWPRTFVFDGTNYKTPQTVTVRALEDQRVEGTQYETIHHSISSMDSTYALLDEEDYYVKVEIVDNDSPGIALEESGGSTHVTEAGPTDSYSVVLLAQPAGNVAISASVNDPDQLVVTPPSLAFTSSNWSVPQFFTVSAVDDSTPEGPHSGFISHTVTSNNSSYNGFQLRNVTVLISDNDTPAVLISESGGSTTVTEGGVADNYSVVLSKRPTAEVVVMALHDERLLVNPSLLKFNAGNFDKPQSVQVEARDDIYVQDPQWVTIAHKVSSADGAYDGAPARSVVARVLDNDVPAVLIEETGGATAVAEGGAGDRYFVFLTAQPVSDVYVTPNDGSGQLHFVEEYLRFTSENYKQPQPIDVSMMDIDNRAMGTRRLPVLHDVSSGDTVFDGMVVRPLEVEVFDNDSPAVLVQESNGSTTVEEGGVADSYTISLATEPLEDVTVTLSAGGDLEVEPETIVFMPRFGGNGPQLVTVRARDDRLADGDGIGHIQHRVSSQDRHYAGLPVRDVVVQVIDDDFPGVLLAETDGATSVIEGGGKDSYSISLQSQPVADVTVTLSESSGAVIYSPTVLRFTPDDFDIPQHVDVDVVDDDVASPSRTATITHDVESEDENYQGFSVESIQVVLEDNDVPRITRAESNGGTWVTEGGADDNYWLTISTRPTVDVVVEIISGDQVLATPKTVTFTPENFGTAQRVTLTAVNDSKIEGPQEVLVGHRVTSTDPMYNGVTVTDLLVNVIDNDVERKSRSVWNTGATNAWMLLILAAGAFARRRTRPQ